MVGDTLTGKRHVTENDKDSKLLMALKSKRASFQRLIVTRVPRQLLAFADGLLRDTYVQLARNSQIMYPRFANQSADKWAYDLNGLPIFHLSMTADAKSKIKKFGKPLSGEPSHMKYFIEVVESMKLSALFNLMKTLNPTTVYLAIYEIETKPEDVLKDIYDLMGNSICGKNDNWSILVCGPALNPEGSVLVTFDGLCFEGGPDVELTISLCSSENKSTLLANGYMELSASAFIHYHGPVVPR